jgi:hypothetical protein
MNEIDRLRKLVNKQKRILSSFGYPEKKPTMKSDPLYWKNKYKSLMEEKIKIERLYGELWTISKSIVTDNKIQKGKYKNVQGPTGEFLFEGEEKISEIVNSYKPFGNVF